MPKVSLLQASMNSGELSPLIFARSDVDKYRNGLSVCLNARVLVEGAWSRRAGEYYVAPTKLNGVARLVRFEFSITQAYILEMGDLYFRFYKDNGAILGTALTITAATAANPVVITYTGTDPANGAAMELSGVVGMTQLNGRRVVVTNVNAGANTFEAYDDDGTALDGSAFTAYVSGGTASPVYEIVSPYEEENLFSMRFAQSTDTLYPAHKAYKPRKITRSAHTAWTITTIDFKDGPYQAVNTATTTLTLSGTTGSVTVTASAVTGINNGSGFQTTDVGRLIRWKDPAGNWTWLTITAWTSTTVVTATISGPDASAGTATVNWRLGAYSDTTGYPAAVCFFQDRLCYGGTTSEPQRVDLSSTGEYENFAPSDADGTVTASNGLSFTLNSSSMNVIRWMRDDEKGLMIGTVGGEWVLRASSLGEAISATNVTANESTNHGSADVQPVKAGKAILFLQRSGRKLRELAYVFQDDGFKSPNMNRLASHITYGGVKQLAFEQEPFSTVWAARNDGILLGFTYERDDSVFGWHRHQFGGYSDVNRRDHAKCESVESIPSMSGLRDETWTIVQRYINGAVRRYVGYQRAAIEREDQHHDSFYVDAGLVLDNRINQTLTIGPGGDSAGAQEVAFIAGGAVFVPTDVNRYIHYDHYVDGVLQYRSSAQITEYLSAQIVECKILVAWPDLSLIAAGEWRISVTEVGGLWHLEGETVDVFGDGATLPRRVVTNGSVALSYPASKVAVGLPYNSDGRTMRPEGGSADGTSQGKLRRIHKVTFRLHNTLGLKIGPTFDSLVQKTFRVSSDPMNLAPPLFSGDKTWEWEGDYDQDGYICWRQDQPEPATVLAIMPQLHVQDG